MPEPSLLSAMTLSSPFLVVARAPLLMFNTEDGLYGNHMRKNSNKREVNKTTIKIHDSSASDVADPCAGLDHVGGRDAGGRQIWGGDVFTAHMACWEEFSFCGKTWPGFSFPAFVGIARGGGSINQRFSRHVSFATRVTFCACWEDFFLDEKIGRVFSSLFWLA